MNLRQIRKVLQAAVDTYVREIKDEGISCEYKRIPDIVSDFIKYLQYFDDEMKEDSEHIPQWRRNRDHW